MVEQVRPVELARRLKETKGLTLLDVREDWERKAAHIEPSVHVPMDAVPDRLSELPRDGPLVVYCHHGGRSQAVAGYLESQGFKRVSNLAGGIDAWSVQVDTQVPRYS